MTKKLWPWVTSQWVAQHLLFVTLWKFLNARLYCLGDKQIFHCTMKHLHSECVYNVKQTNEVHWCRWFEFLHAQIDIDRSNLIGWYYDCLIISDWLILWLFDHIWLADTRAVASLTVPGGQEFHFPHFFLKFRSIFPQTLLIFFLNLALRVGESPTREGPGYATGWYYDEMSIKSRENCL